MEVCKFRYEKSNLRNFCVRFAAQPMGTQTPNLMSEIACG